MDELPLDPLLLPLELPLELVDSSVVPLDDDPVLVLSGPVLVLPGPLLVLPGPVLVLSTPVPVLSTPVLVLVLDAPLELVSPVLTPEVVGVTSPVDEMVEELPAVVLPSVSTPGPGSLQAVPAQPARRTSFHSRGLSMDRMVTDTTHGIARSMHESTHAQR